MWAIVPIKRFQSAKQRLSPIASVRQRAALAEAMAVHLLKELTSARSLSGVLVVSSERSLRGPTEKLGFAFLPDEGAGLNEVLQCAGMRLARAGVSEMVIIHADLPLFSAQEFDRVAALHAQGPARKMTLVSDAKGCGTNIRFCRPGLAVPPLYGLQSALHHREAAFAGGLRTETVHSLALSLDCDTPEDLRPILRALQRSAASGIRAIRLPADRLLEPSRILEESEYDL